MPEYQYVTTAARQRHYYDNELHSGTLGKENKSSNDREKKRRPFSAVVSRQKTNIKIEKERVSGSLTSLSSIDDEKEKDDKRIFHRWDPKNDDFVKDWLKDKRKIEKHKRKQKKKELKEKEEKEKEEQELKKAKQKMGEQAFKEWSQKKQREIVDKRNHMIEEHKKRLEEEEEKDKEMKERMEKLYEEWIKIKEREKKLLAKRNNIKTNKLGDIDQSDFTMDMKNNKEFLEWLRRRKKELNWKKRQEKLDSSRKNRDGKDNKLNSLADDKKKAEKRRRLAKKTNLKSVSKKDVEKLSEKCDKLKMKDDEIINSTNNTIGKQKAREEYSIKSREQYEDELIKQNEDLISKLEQKDNMEIISRLENQIDADKKDAAFKQDNLSTGRKSANNLQIELVEQWNSSMTFEDGENEESPSVSLSLANDDDESRSEIVEPTQPPREGVVPFKNTEDDVIEEDDSNRDDNYPQSTESKDAIINSKDSGAVLNETEDQSQKTESENIPKNLKLNNEDVSDEDSKDKNENTEPNSTENNQEDSDESLTNLNENKKANQQSES